MLKKVTLSLGKMNLQIEMEGEKIQQLIDGIFQPADDDRLCVSDYLPEDKKALGEPLWIRKSSVIMIGVASTSNVQIARPIINQGQMSRV